MTKYDEDSKEFHEQTREMVDRFKSMVDQSKGPDACWNWMGPKRQDGYGLFFLESEDPRDDQFMLAHRYAWFVFSPMPDGKHVRHIPEDKVYSQKCENKLCCNPKHMSFLTRSEISRNSKKKVCVNGHELPAPKMKDGKMIRVCPECNRIRQAEYRKSKSEVLPFD